MKQVEAGKKFNSQEEYFLFEESSELKHELINGNLFEMSGVSIFHNDIVLNIFSLLKQFLKQSDYKITVEAFKMRTPEGNFFYPDVAVLHSNTQKYYSESPLLIVAVPSDSTRTFDLTDKFIQYKKIQSLSYYLCVEPELQVVIFYFKNENGEWLAETYIKDEDTINLPAHNISFALKDIYHP